MPDFTIIHSSTDGQVNIEPWGPVIGDVVLDDTSLVKYEIGSNHNVTVKCDVEDGYRSKLYRTELDCVVAHSTTDVSPLGEAIPIDFTHYDTVVVSNQGTVSSTLIPLDSVENPDGYWIAAVNRLEPFKGCLDIIGGKRLRWKPVGGGIAITDMSRPSVDCKDYVRLAGYIRIIDDAINHISQQAADEPGEVDGEKIYGLFNQYRAMRELWNYLVIRSMVSFSTTYQADKAYVQGRLVNNTGDDLYVSDIKIDFPSDEIPPESGERKLDVILDNMMMWFDNQYGNQPSLTYVGAERQTMAGASFTLKTQEGGVVVHPGETVQAQATFKISATISPSDPLSLDVQHRDTPWAGQWPVISDGKIAKPGRLSYYNTHFNPTTYGSIVPDNLPPTGDGCVMRMAPGTATAAWNAAGLARCVLRPELYIGLSCTADSLSSSFLVNFSGGVECADKGEGEYSLSFTATTCTLMLTPTGGSPFAVLTITMTNRHFHEGDGIALALPKGWSDELANALQGGLNVPAECAWTLPSSSLIPSESEAGATKSIYIPEAAVTEGNMLKRIKLDSQMYKFDSIRGIDVYASAIEET